MSGPGRLTQAFGIDRRHNEIDLLSGGSELSIIQTDYEPEIEISQRIGIAVGKGDELMRRYVDGKYIDWVTRHRFNSRRFRGHPE